MTSRFGFLSDEERLAERGPAAVARVRRAMSGGDTAQLFRAAHLLAVALFRVRRTLDAAEVSRCAVDCARRLAACPGQEADLFHALRPQLDLLAVEARVGDPDLALAGLSGLDDLAAGRPALVGGLRFDDAAVTAALAAGHPLPALAADARMVDTCKILLRHGRHAELLAFAERYPTGVPTTMEVMASITGRAPLPSIAAPDRQVSAAFESSRRSVAVVSRLERDVRNARYQESSSLLTAERSATSLPKDPHSPPPHPGHAAEAPWLVCPLDLPTPDPAELPTLPPDQARLGFAQAVHTAAAAEPRTAGRLVRDLTRVRDLLNAGPWLSELTPVRCLVSLADVAARLGLDGIVRTLALEARADAACAGDHRLAADADALLRGRPRPAVPHADPVTDGSPADFDEVTVAVLEQLAARGAVR